MKRRWTRLSALLILIPLMASAKITESRHLNRLSFMEGHVLAADYGRSWAADTMHDEPEPPAVAVQDFGLVSGTEGWVISGHRLYWTKSGGQSWHDISPVDQGGPEVLAVFFLDASRGWAVTKGAESAGLGEYSLARTLDGGGTWEVTPVHLFPPGPPVAPAQDVYLRFIDARTGWLVIKHVSGSNFSVGTLFKTSDGGSTWAQLSMPIGEPVYFATEDAGWTAGGAAGNELYRTLDGGESWQAQNVAPGSDDADQGRFYRLPRFWDEHEGLLSVVAVGEQAQLELYATHDGGARWELVAAVPLRQGATSAEGLPFTLVPSARAAMVLPEDDLLVTASARGEITASVARRDATGEITRLEMVTPSAGWAIQTSGRCTPAPTAPDRARSASGREPDCRSETRLLGTVDGGQTWAALPLPRITTSGTASRPGSQASEGERGGGTAVPGGSFAGRTAIFAGQGFDKCEIASIAQLGTWIVESPYRAVNLYIGGVARACSNQALTSALVSELSGLGWRFIPTWVGPQAPCYPSSKPRMSLDPAISRIQGIDEANAAADVAANLGLARPDGSDAIIYYDIEHYDTNNLACHEAVKAFVAGWTEQLHARASLAGVYGNGPPLSSFSTLSDVPDAIWPANWVFSSYNPSAAVWDVYRLSNDLWNDHQRIRQYSGGHTETWGSVSLNIDSNVIDGIVASTGLPASASGVYLPLVSSKR
jgi:photosystem II stability/assembly factor-like uncharacterized protein